MKYITVLLLLFVLTAPAQDKKQAPKDSVGTVSLADMDKDIQQRTDQLTKLLADIDATKKQIEAAEKQAIYLQGALDMLKGERAKAQPKEVKKK